MENKKNTNADLTKKRSLFLVTGLILSLSVTLAAFEWKSFNEGELMTFQQLPNDFDELMEVPVTVIPPPQKPIQQPKIREIEDDEEVIDDVEFNMDIDVDETDILEDIVFDELTDEEPTDQIFLIVEEEASFPGGNKAWSKFLNKNFKYPRKAQRMGIEGRVFLSFVVDQNGAISDIVVTRGIGGGCDEEAIRVLKNSPMWNPGKQRGVPVKSRMALQIAFQLK